MPQAGIHGLVGMATRKWTGSREWLLLGAILGSFVPDMDNLGVAVATVLKAPTEGIHRTMTHSVFFMLAIVILFYLFSMWRKDSRWLTLGVGLGLGMLLHSLLDLVLWFNGVALFWPFGSEINFWANTTPPAWFMTFLEPAEFLCFALFLWALGAWARKTGMDAEYLKTHRLWLISQVALFVILTPLAYIITKGYRTIFGVLYLFSLFMTFFVTIRMRKTVEAAAR